MTSTKVALAAAMFGLGYLQSRTDQGFSHPAWFLLAVAVTLVVVCADELRESK